ANGESRYGRYRIDPLAGVHLLTKGQVAEAKPGYLADEIRARLAQGPIRFQFRVQLAAPVDKIEDPSIAWPDARPTIDLGVLEMTAVASDSEAQERALLFLPGALPAGIEAADPMIAARQASYPISFERRHHQ